MLELNESEGFRSQENQVWKKNNKDSGFDSPLTIITKSTNVSRAFYKSKKKSKFDVFLLIFFN